MNQQLPELLRRQLRNNPLFLFFLTVFPEYFAEYREKFSSCSFFPTDIFGFATRTPDVYRICAFPVRFFLVRRSISARFEFKNELMFGNCRISAGFWYFFQMNPLSGFFWYFFLEWINQGGKFICLRNRPEIHRCLTDYRDNYI